MKIYSFFDDFVFKVVFGKKGNEPLLMRLLDALLHREGPERIAGLQILNPFNLKETADAKFTVVDVKAVDGLGQRFTIEVQARGSEAFIPRMAYYLAHLYAGQLAEGDGFEKLGPCFGIALLNFRQFPWPEPFQSVFRFHEAASGLVLPGPLMELNFVELPKFLARRERRLQTRLEKWLNVLGFGERYAAGESVPAECADEEGLFMAVDQLKSVNADAEIRQVLELRAKEAHDRATFLAEARQEGRQEGREEGREEKARSIARAMLAEKVPADLIARVTGLSLGEIERLRPARPV